jgi:hypothetical protein
MRFCWTRILPFGGENLKSYGKISRRKEVKRWRSLLDFSKHPSDGWRMPPVVLTGLIPTFRFTLQLDQKKLNRRLFDKEG